MEVPNQINEAWDLVMAKEGLLSRHQAYFPDENIWASTESGCCAALSDANHNHTSSSSPWQQAFLGSFRPENGLKLTLKCNILLSKLSISS